MPERLITPQDFTTGTPPRLMGTEAEDHVGLKVYESGTPLREDHITIRKMLSEATFKKAGITSFYDGATQWLTNGESMYADGYLLESCTAEQLGPKNALAGTMAGIHVLEKIADASDLSVQIFRRTATVDPETYLMSKASFHMNHITPAETAEYLKSDGFLALNTHAATRFYTWEGMVAPEGFTLSQKANISTYVYKMKDKVGAGFSRIEDYSGDASSPWGTFMAMATTSILLRVVEHPEQHDLNNRLSGLQIKDPYKTMRAVSADTTMKEKLRLKNGRKMTAIQIQKELADIATEFGRRFKLPKDEQYAVDEWQNVCRDLQEAADSGNIRPLATRIGWASKKLWLESKHIGELHAGNHEAVKLDMSWDALYPKQGGRLIYPQKTGLTIVTDSEVAALVDNPPQDTRAAVRSNYIQNPPFQILGIDWDRLWDTSYDYPNIRLHPYKTER